MLMIMWLFKDEVMFVMNILNDLGSFNTYENFSKRWSIDSDLKDINKDREKCK